MESELSCYTNHWLKTHRGRTFMSWAHHGQSPLRVTFVPIARAPVCVWRGKGSPGKRDYQPPLPPLDCSQWNYFPLHRYNQRPYWIIQRGNSTSFTGAEITGRGLDFSGGPGQTKRQETLGPWHVSGYTPLLIFSRYHPRWDPRPPVPCFLASGDLTGTSRMLLGTPTRDHQERIS